MRKETREGVWAINNLSNIFFFFFFFFLLVDIHVDRKEVGNERWYICALKMVDAHE